jgi:hypothetical protein
MYGRVNPLTFILMAACLVALALLLASSARQGLPRPARGGPVRLFRHNGLFRGFAIAAAAGLPVGLAGLLYFHPPQRADVPYLVGLFLVFAIITLPLVWEAGRYYVLVTPAGLECRSPWRGVRALAWDDVVDVRYSAMNAWFEFVGRDGDRIRAHAFVAALNDLLALVEARVPASVLKGARAGYARIGRAFPPLTDEPVLEAKAPRRVGEW